MNFVAANLFLRRRGRRRCPRWRPNPRIVALALAAAITITPISEAFAGVDGDHASKSERIYAAIRTAAEKARTWWQGKSLASPDWLKHSAAAIPGKADVKTAVSSAWSRIQLPSRAAISSWTAENLAFPDATTVESEIDWLRAKAGAAMPVSIWVRSGEFARSSFVDLGDAAAKGWALVPKNRIWWADMGLASAGVGVVVGWASFGCAVVAAPGGPVLVALASGACGSVGVGAGEKLVRLGYGWAGWNIDESALAVGRIVGAAGGTIVGLRGADRFITWRRFSQFRDFGDYSRLARRLTRSSLRPVSDDVAAARASGFDIDHVIPVKCGWKYLIAPESIGSLNNLQALPAAINRAIGAKGC